MTLPRFDYLAQLHRFRDEQPEGLRMSALSRYLMVTGGNVTSLTDELEKSGLVLDQFVCLHGLPVPTTAYSAVLLEARA